jgi:hypothetical protein
MSTPQPQVYVAGEYINDAAATQAAVPVTQAVPAGAALLALGGAGTALAPWPVLQQVSDSRGNGWTVHATTPGANRVSALASARVTGPLLPGDQVTAQAAGAAFTRWQLLAVVPPPGWALQPAPGSVQTGGATATIVALPALGPAGPAGALGVIAFIQAGVAVFSASSWPLFATTGGTPTLRSFTTSAAPGAAVPAFSGTLAASAAHSLVGVRLDLVPWPVLAPAVPAAVSGEAGTPFILPLEAAGGWPPYDWAAGDPPPGLAVDAARLAGVPTADGEWATTVTVTDASGAQAHAAIAIVIGPRPPPPPPPPAWTGPGIRLPAEWTFWADTIIGSVPLGPVQPVAFSCERLLSGFGKGEVTLPVASSALDRARLLRLWSWRLWCFYGGDPYWCGVPDGIADEGAATVTLTLTELTGYLARRQWDVTPPARYDQVEQTAIAADIAAPLADVGVLVVTDPGPGVLRDRTYEYLESESRAQLLANLSAVGAAENQAAGPQFRTEYDMAAGRPRATLRIAYPRVGAATGLGMTVPGNATGLGAAWDADQLRTRTFAVGELPEDAPEDAPVPVVVEDRPQPDLPRLDAADDWPGVQRISTLTERAKTAAGQYAQPTLDLTETGQIASPPVSSYGPGDDVTVRLVSPLLPGGLEVTGQLAAVAVNAAESSAEWTVAVTLPPPQPRATLTQRLDRIDLTLTASRRRGLAPLT